MQLLFWLLFFILPVCQHEDSTNCAWHAGSQGNGIGLDFISWGQGDDMVTIYGPLHYADGRTDYDVDYTVSFGSDVDIED